MKAFSQINIFFPRPTRMHGWANGSMAHQYIVLFVLAQLTTVHSNAHLGFCRVIISASYISHETLFLSEVCEGFVGVLCTRGHEGFQLMAVTAVRRSSGHWTGTLPVLRTQRTRVKSTRHISKSDREGDY